jgi:uncharacterized RDD family membrane protein YckC
MTADANSTALPEPAQINLPSPGLLRRFAAMVYDSLLLLAVIMVYGTLVMIINLLLQRPMTGEGQVYEGYWGLLVLAGLIGSVVGFFCFFWRKSGQTLGMRSWRMRLVDSNLHTPSLRQCLLRCLLASISLASLGLGYLWCWLDPKGFTFHDRFSGTQLVLEPKEKKR